MSEEILINVQEVRKMLEQRYRDGLSLVNNEILKGSINNKYVFVSNEKFNSVGCYYNDDVLIERIRAKGYTVDVIPPCFGEDGGISISGW